MERRLKITADVLEILLNFMVFLGLETVADAALGGLSAPVYALFLPLLAPLVFYAARLLSRHLIVFLAIHVAVIAALNCLAGFLPVPLLWKILFTAVGLIYAIMSIRIRLTRQDYSEGEAPAGFMATAAALFFLGCSYLGFKEACARILWLALLWLPGHWMKSYLDNFLYYMKMNRQAAGAMPERRILRGGIISVAIYAGFSFAVLTLYSKTALVARLSELVRKAGYLLLKLFFQFLLLFLEETEEGKVVSDAAGGMEQMMFAAESAQTPLWMQILDKILVTAVAVMLIAGIIFSLVMLVRFMIRSFYSREKVKKEVRQEGFVEEQERLQERKEPGRMRLFAVGGTPAQRVRRIFKKTVQELAKGKAEAGTMDARTARELAALCAGKALKPGAAVADGALRARMSGEASPVDVACSPEPETNAAEWNALTALYERARYTQESVTKEDVREAGRLSKALLLHMIK